MDDSNLTIFDISKVLWAISRTAESGDYEAAHSMEDDLYERVLKAIVDGKCDDPKSIAAAALKSQEIDFDRHCA